MLRLVLVRHAKSAWDNASLSDFDRPLAPRGRAAAAWIGETFRDRGWTAEQVICSPAARTRETLALSGIDAAEVGFDRRVYDLRDEDYVDLVRELGQRRSVMLVGHNSAISATAAVLAQPNPGPFPTGAIAVLDFDAEEWAALEAASGRVVAFLKPPKE